MVRPRKVNKESMTTAAVSENLVKAINLSRPANRSIGDFLNQVFQEWKGLKSENFELKENAEFLGEWMKNQEKKIQEQTEVIEVLKKDKEELERRVQIVQ